MAKDEELVFSVYRDCDTLRLRKWVIELRVLGELVDRRRMFGGPFFTKRLKWKLKLMTYRRLTIEAALKSF